LGGRRRRDRERGGKANQGREKRRESEEETRRGKL
jgi:hypothetical protein